MTPVLQVKVYDLIYTLSRDLHVDMGCVLIIQIRDDMFTPGVNAASESLQDPAALRIQFKFENS